MALVSLVIYAAIEATKPPPPIEGAESFANLSRDHVSGAVTYEPRPPVGGDHQPAWQNCGVYDQPIANENGVHSLEHGAVWITYQPDINPHDIWRLQALTRRSPYRLLSPYPNLPSPIVISTWGHQLRLESAGDLRLNQFIETYEQGHDTPELGAPCIGGVGKPQ